MPKHNGSPELSPIFHPADELDLLPGGLAPRDGERELRELQSIERNVRQLLEEADDRTIDALLQSVEYDPGEITRQALDLREEVQRQYMPPADPGGSAATQTRTVRSCASLAGRHGSAGVPLLKREELGWAEPIPAERTLALYYFIEPRLQEEESICSRFWRNAQSSTGILGRVAHTIDLVKLDDCSRHAVLQHPDRDASTLFLIALTADCLVPRGDLAAAAQITTALERLPAFRQWLEAGKPRALFLLRIDQPENEDEGLVRLWREDLPGALLPTGSSTRFACYSDPDELGEGLELDFCRWLLEVRLAAAPGECQQTRAPHQVVLCLMIGETAGLVAGDYLRLSETLDLLWEKIIPAVTMQGGKPIRRAMDLAFFGFHGSEACEKAVGTAGSLLDRFNKKSDGSSLALRAAISRDVAAALPNYTTTECYLLALLEHFPLSAPLLVTSQIYDELGLVTRRVFSPLGRFHAEPVRVSLAHGYRLEDALRQCADQYEIRVAMLNVMIGQDLDHPRRRSAVSVALDESYSALESFCDLFQRQVDPSRVAGSPVARFLKQVQSLEERTWTRLLSLTPRSCSDTPGGTLRALIHLTAVRRAPCVVRIRSLRRSAGRAFGVAVDGAELRSPEAAGGEGGEGAVSENAFSVGVLDDLNQLVKGDELDEYVAYTDLAESHRNELMLFLRSDLPSWRSRRAVLRKRLWRLADLMAAEDAAASCLRAGLLATLSTGPFSDSRFKALCHFLTHSHLRLSSAADDLERFGAAGDEENKGVLLRCVLAVHSNDRIRQQVVWELPFQSLWYLGAYPRTPLPCLATIVTRLGDAGLESYGRIFFDCVRSRIVRCLEKAIPAPDLSALRTILVKFAEFEFAVETHYFERLKFLVDLYRQRGDANDAGGRELWNKLEPSTDRGHSRPPVPEAIGSLPLGVQRHLASEGAYVEYFVSHPDYRIARETLRFLKPDNVGAYVKNRSINGHLFQELLSKPELFRRRDVVLIALHHPKCAPAFALHHLPRMSSSELVRLVRDPHASTRVRAEAERLSKVRGLFPAKRGRLRRSAVPSV